MEDTKLYNKPISFSQNEMFWTCPKSWYYKYVLDIPRVEDLKYAHRGNVVHNCLEVYYPDKTMPIEEVKELFEKEWKKYKLDETNLKNQKDATWQMVQNGINLNLHATSTELKVFFPDVVGYIDVVDSKNGIFYDWKTSTRSEENEATYPLQLKYYSYLYWRKMREIIKVAAVRYLKYKDERAVLEVNITDKDIENAEIWHYKTREKMQYYIDNPKKLPAFNKNYHWSPYKHLWDLEEKDPSTLFKITLLIQGNYVYLKGDIDEFLMQHLENKYSYELKDAYFIKKRNQHANTTVRLWSKKMRRIAIGYLDQIKKTLYDYAQYKNKTPVITIQDNRKFNEETITMPEKLLTGKELRDYQEESVDKYLNKKGGNIAVLELITGAGKSLIFTEIIRRLGYKTLIVVDKKELLMQTKKVLEEELGIPIGIIGDGQKQIEHITVATIQTLHKNIDEYKDYLSTIRFWVTDECHKISAKSYYNLGHHLTNTSHRLGVSATYKRDDGNDMMLTATAGDIIHSITGQTLIDKGYLMRPNIYFTKYNIPEQYITEVEKKLLDNIKGINKAQKTVDMKSVEATEEDIQYLSYYPEIIVRNPHRNEIIKTTVEKNKDKTILILVKQIEHGELLQELLPGSKYIYGETNTKEREQSLKDFKTGKLKILISTISIFAEGVDIPSLDIVINAAANKGDIKTIQVLGRVLRKKEGKETAEYYDFYDTYKFFYNASRARRTAFKNEGHKVTIIE